MLNSTGTCIFEGCGEPKLNVSGLCGKHYGRYMKDGHPEVEESRRKSARMVELDARKRFLVRRARLASYGMTEADYERMWERQSGLCAICKRELVQTGMKCCNIDHDHQTGKVRGLLCRPCNQGMGLLGDDPDRLASAVAYLRSA